jgi:hydrogenase maturation protein HypF
MTHHPCPNHFAICAALGSLSSVALSSAQMTVSLSDPSYFRQFVVLTLGSSIVVKTLPYDRSNTTMRTFPLCPACRAEYTDPSDRRFHAQPNACAACGPQVAFYRRLKSEGWGLETGASSNLHSPISNSRWPATFGAWALACVEDEALHAAAVAIRRGEIIAVKGLSGFHLMADARNADAVQQLRVRKVRPDKPLAVMVRDLAQASALCEISPPVAELLASAAAPIVLLSRRVDASIAAEVAPGNPDLGVMLAATPLHHLLLAELDFPVVATSGNLTDEPICTDEWEAFDRLGEIADSFLIHDRPIARHADDSVLWMVEGAPRFLRRARGYAPLPVRAPQPLPTILGVGAHLKNTVALSVGAQIFLSQHIGDLETAPALAAFERVIADFLHLYEANPAAIAHDLHPGIFVDEMGNLSIPQTPSHPCSASPRPSGRVSGGQRRKHAGAGTDLGRRRLRAGRHDLGGRVSSG